MYDILGDLKPNSQFLGTSDDEKPTDCPDMSLFYELDTKDLYYLSDGEWIKVGESGGGK